MKVLQFLAIIAAFLAMPVAAQSASQPGAEVMSGSVSPAAPISPVTKPRGRGPLPTASTQPMPTSARPSIGFISATNLAERCESSAASLVSYCFAYITGVHDTVRAYETWLRIREFCPPVTSSQADMRRAFLSYLKANPTSGAGEAASVIVLAFKEQFTCDTHRPEPERPASKR